MLVVSARTGDSEAFAQLVRRHEGWVRNMMVARLKRMDEVEEAAQETFTRAFSALAALKQPEAFRGWLRTIGNRVALDLLDGRHSLARVPEAEEPSVPPEASPAEAVERRQAVARAIESLEEPTRDVVVLRYDEGLSCAEIAKTLGISVPAVTMRLTRAHRELAKTLAGWGAPL